MNSTQTFILVALAGIAVLGLFAFLGGGFGPPAPPNPFAGSRFVAPVLNGVQEVDLRALDSGTYNYSTIILQQGIPTRIHYTADPGAGCGREVIIPLAKARKLAPTQGEALIEFTPSEKGKYPFYCSMRMFRGTIEVV